MVLCPFVYLLLRHDIPPLALQPTEVHSTHWVPLRSLLSPFLRSTERADISDRLKPQRGPLAKALIRAVIGQLVFTSTLLTPSESLHCSSAPGFVPTTSRAPTATKNVSFHLAERLGLGFLVTIQPPQAGISGPYPLWGLTLGVVADLLHQISPQAATSSTLCGWPTFSHWDIRAMLWLLTYKFRHHHHHHHHQKNNSNDKSAMAVPEVRGLDDTTSAVSTWQQPSTSLAAAHLPDEYFRQMRKAVMYACVLRANAVAVVVVAVLLVRYHYRARRR